MRRPQTLLTPNEYDDIATSPLRVNELARKYGVGHYLVSKIRRRARLRGVPQPQHRTLLTAAQERAIARDPRSQRAISDEYHIGTRRIAAIREAHATRDALWPMVGNRWNWEAILDILGKLKLRFVG